LGGQGRVDDMGNFPTGTLQEADIIINTGINAGENHLQMGNMVKAGEALENTRDKVKGPGL